MAEWGVFAVIRRVFGLFCISGFLLAPQAARAGFVNVWTLGTENGSNEEFGPETGVNSPPGSATVKDDDYYFAGSYSIGNVAVNEPLVNFEWAVTTSDPKNRIHFNLSAAQATATARARVTVRLIWGGWWNSALNQRGKGFGTHNISLKINGATIRTAVVTQDTRVIAEAGVPAFALVTGENVVEIHRAGGTADAWVGVDFAMMEVDPTGMMDADSDGLPRYWEEENGLNDAFAGDAVQDPDGDGSSNTQEFARGTNARNRDTDGDGLADGAETVTSPLSADHDGDTLLDGAELALVPATNPLLTDTDSDGAPDAWEVRTGFDATSAASTPPAFPHAVGVKFVSDSRPDSRLAPLAVTGFAPQMNWNNTRPLYTWAESATGDTSDILSPSAGVLVNSAGAGTGMTISWSAQYVLVNNNAGGSNQTLLDSFLNTSSDVKPVSVTLGGIPFTTYDVLVYVGGTYDGAVGYARLNDSPATDKYFLAGSTRPEINLVEPPVSSPSRPWRGNVLRFRNQTGASCNVKVFRTLTHELGMHAIQIVNATADLDGDTMPDWWELAHKLKPNLASDAAADIDGDGLTNAQEFVKQTNPRVADTDGDGLNDGAETTTNPLLADTDGDGISDGAELARKPAATNPLLADTDGDGRSDGDEIRQGTDPLVSNGATANMPVVTTSPSHTFDWTSPVFQFVWDHTRGLSSNGEWGDDTLFNITVRNNLATWESALYMGLRMKGQRLSYLLFTNYLSAFSAQNSSLESSWEADWNEQPADLRAGLGFSGVGRVDISDRVRLRLTGTTPGSASNWTLTFELRNMDSNVVVASRTMTNRTLAASVYSNNNIVWQNDSGAVNRFSLWTHAGVQVFTHATPLGDTPAFAAHKDTDKDGMPDVWEMANGLNKNSAADAALDGDLDGLSNLREYLAGTNPANPDTDNDTVPDGAEVDGGSDPLLASSKPPYYRGTPAGIIGEDFNGNGMADAWESWIGRFDLAPGGDADGDGCTNAMESVAGTNPFDPNSRLWADELRQGNDFILRWPVLPYKLHRAWTSPNLSSWSMAAGTPVIVSGEYRQTFTGDLAGGTKFYQARVSDMDTDGDGVSDWTEANVLGSSLTSGTSLRASLPVDDNGDGVVDRQLSGDYAALLARFHGGGATGGFSTGGGSYGGGVSRESASRFLMQASFGPARTDIERVQALGYSAWITEQMAKPATLHSTYIKGITDDFFGQRASPDYSYNDTDQFINGNNMMTAFARAAIQGEDQLRQRVAFALSQIIVASRRDANLESRPLAMANFYDIFTRQAFGSYYDILLEVTLHPVMGRYLSHVGNQKADPVINRYPDENYARELMQLFTIGLWQLNPDGTRQVNGGGQNIPTYSNQEITQFARVMTGLWFGGRDWGNGGWTDPDHTTPMTMNAPQHDFGAKMLLNGYTIPARAATAEKGMADVADAVRNLFEHANTGPFVCRQLIQFLVTDNPTPGYVQRIAAVFANNGSGVRGDLGAVVRAILLDDEARNPAVKDNTVNYGRLKEPVIRVMALGRAFGLRSVSGLLWWDWGDFIAAAKQEPTNSPSVFNFYRPDYRAPGLLTQNNAAGPVFQITDSYSSISFPNRLWKIITEGISYWGSYEFPFDLSAEIALAGTPDKLVDHLNTLFCGGGMKMGTRAILLNAITQIPANQTEARARVAVYLTITAPEGAVMK